MSLRKFWVAGGVVSGLLCLLFIHQLSAAVVWDGPNISFSKPSHGDWNLPQNQDRITDTVWITRRDTAGIFNIRTEPEYDFFVSPENTEWAWPMNNPGQTIAASNYQNLNFEVWVVAHDQDPPSTVNQPGVLHIISEDIYIDIKFTSWGMRGDGRFSYVRSTPPAEPICPADLTGDENVDVSDLFQLLAGWNTNGPGANLAPPNDVVDVSDLFALLAAWGACN